MTTEIETPRSRRALLTVGLAAGAATVAAAIGRPLPVDAADGQAVLVGGEYAASSKTKFDTGTTGAVALEGFSASSIGVVGQSASYLGVFGFSGAHTGVYGQSVSGVGVQAVSNGMALKVDGKAQFSRSGKASVPPGKKYVDVTVPGGLVANSVVHATMMTYRKGVAVAAARKNYPTTGKVRINLTKVASTSTAIKVGWFVVEY